MSYKGVYVEVKRRAHMPCKTRRLYSCNIWHTKYFITPAHYETDPSVCESSGFALISPISAVMKGRCRWQSGREGRRAAGRFSITLTQHGPTSPALQQALTAWNLRIIGGWLIPGTSEGCTNYELQSIPTPKFYSITVRWMWKPLLERADVRVSIGCPQRRSEEWRFLLL